MTVVMCYQALIKLNKNINYVNREFIITSLSIFIMNISLQVGNVFIIRTALQYNMLFKSKMKASSYNIKILLNKY